MKKQPREKLYKIGEVAEMLGVHEDTLRNWERQGLVTPVRIGTRKDRRYTAEHIRQIREQGLVSDLAKKAPTKVKEYENYSREDLIKELQILKKQKKYGLVWEEHTEEVVERCKTEAPILERVKDKQIKDKDKNKPTNILIEGDNYHALQVLNYTHKGKIDVIYIDPPYNTGNKDFIYNDHYVDKEDNFRHSKWLSFMEKRLRLAKNLLSKSGAIFISIDDNEQAQLKLLCDEIFGEGNFVANIIWQGMDTIKNDVKYFSKNHEYILVYAKHKDYLSIRGIKRTEEQNKVYKNRDNDPRGAYLLTPLHAKSGTDNNKYEYTFKNGVKWSPPPGTYPRFSKDTLKKLDNDNRIYFGGRVPQKKTFLNEVSEYVAPTTFWSYELAGSTRQSNTELSNILGKGVFQNPKPTSLIKILLNLIELPDNPIILDFMAGSGTTGHAVLDLNKEDGGNRKFILCTNNENQICEKVTYERLRKVMKGYTTPKGKKVEGLGGSLEYFKIEFVDVENIQKVPDRKKLEFTYEAGQMIALKEDTFKEVAKNKFYQIFTNEKGKFVGIYFRENLEKLPELEKKILDKDEVVLYLFSYGTSDYKQDYADDKNVKVKDIPEPILKIYRSLNA